MNRLWVQLWLAFILFTALTLGVLVAAAFLLDEALPPGEQAPIVLSGVVVLGGTLSVLFAATLARYLAGSISLVSRAAQRIASGDLSARARTATRRSPGRGEMAQLLNLFDGMAESLEKLERDRLAGAAALAHELRTPLTILKGRLEALRDGVFSPTSKEFGLLLVQIDSLSRLVEDLRTLSLAEAGKLSLNLERVDLARLAQAVIDSSETQAVARGVQFVLNVHGEVQVMGDERRLQQIVTNLVDNALAFSPQGGRVYVSLTSDPSQVVLSVRDTGPGVRPEALAHIFERFYQDDTARSSNGVGLGLAIVRSLVSLHGGHVEARNHPQGGAEFCVTLPL